MASLVLADINVEGLGSSSSLKDLGRNADVHNFNLDVRRAELIC